MGFKLKVMEELRDGEWNTVAEAGEGVLFLVLVMDMVAKDIVGWDISEFLEADGSVRALKMAGRRLPKASTPTLLTPSPKCQPKPGT